MTKKETVALFLLIAALFPREKIYAAPDSAMRDAWASQLEDIPFEDAKKAVGVAACKSPFPPSINEIRDYATRLKGQRRLSAEEAWGVAMTLMRIYGTNTVPVEGFSSDDTPPARIGEFVRPKASGVEYEAKRHCPPDVWRLLEQFGYADMCRSENPDVMRGQFMKVWNQQGVEVKEARLLAGIAPEIVNPALIPPSLPLITGGECQAPAESSK